MKLLLFLVGAVCFATVAADLTSQLDGAFDLADPQRVLDDVRLEGGSTQGLEMLQGLLGDALEVEKSGQQQLQKSLEVAPLSPSVDIPEILEPVSAGSTSSIASGSQSVSVNDVDGSVTVTIPIQVPLGTAGAQPTLAMKYYSNDGENHMGVGWKSMGLSAIHRCSKTKDQDTKNEPIQYIVDDAYCLDGDRLICVSGTNGKDGAHYRTVTDSFVDVISHGTTSTGPTSWEVRTKESSTRYYTSQIKVSSGAIRAWPLKTAEDLSGNKVSFSYQMRGTGEYTIENFVLYASGVSDYSTMVSFSYISRASLGLESYSLYVGKNGMVDNTVLLSKITTQTKGGAGGGLIPVYSYEMSYGYKSNNDIYLTEIKQCYSTLCNTPYKFTYSSAGKGSTAYTNENNPSFTQAFYADTYESLDISRTKLADFNGDGVMDVFRYSGNFGATSNVACEIWLANVHTSGTQVTYTKVAGPALPKLSFVIDQAQVTIQTVVLLDWNNDGCSDIYVVNQNGGGDTVYIFNHLTNKFTVMKGPTTGHAFSNNPSIALLDISRYKFSDFNGDGYQDLYYIPGGYGQSSPPANKIYLNHNDGTYTAKSSGIYTPLSGSTSTANYQLAQVKFEDFNSDSITDIYVINQGSTADTLYLGSPECVFSKIAGPKTPVSSILTQSQIDLTRVQFGDFNGDGYNDVYYIAGNGGAGNDYLWFFSGGTTWRQVKGLQGKLVVGTYATTAQTDLNSIKFMDMTNDKGTDIYQMVVEGYDNIYYSLLTGQFTEAAGKGADTPISKTASKRSIDVSRALFGDLNGDGAMDIYWVNGEPETTTRDILRLAPNNKMFMTEVTNPFGVPTTIKYLPLTNSAAYKRGTSAVFPAIDIVGSRYVAYQVTHKGGDGSNQVNTYTYESAQQCQSGAGFLGFKYVKTKQERTGIVMRSEFSQDYNKHLQYKEVAKTVTASNGRQIYHEVTGYSAVAKKYGVNTLYTIHTTSKAIQKNDLGGQNVGHMSDTYTYDGYGNALSATSTSTDSLGTNYVMKVAHTYASNPSTWDVSRRLTTTRTKDLKGEEAIIKISFTYNTKFLLTQQCATSEKSGDNGMKICVTWTLDKFGNKIQTKLSGKNRDGSSMEEKVLSSNFGGDRYARYPNSMTNALGLTEHVTYDYRCGLVNSSTTSVGSGKAKISYNNFCQGITQEFRTTSGGCATAKVDFRLCSVSGSNCPSNAYYAVVSTAPTGTVTWNYFNYFQQLVRTKSTPFSGSAMVISDIHYGPNDEVSAASIPYFAGSTAKWFRYTYDELDRITEITYPNGYTQKTTYAGPAVTTVNALGQKMTTTTNVIKQIVSTTDAQNNVVSFEYAPRGEIISITDPTGYKVTASYDGFGNRLNIVDGHTGKTTFKTDVMGQELKKTLANGEVFTYTYDAGGRPLTRNDHEAKAVWSYNSSTGKLATAKYTSNGGTLINKEHFFYDTLGRPVQKTTQIFSHTWKTYSAYDCNSRVTSTTFPSGLVAKMVYLSNGHLSKVVDEHGVTLWQVLGKTAAGDVSHLRLKGYLDIIRTFDDIGRLITIQAKDTTTGALYQNLKYTWDGVNNLLSRQDLKGGKTETFKYDSLQRIISSAVSGGETVTFSYKANGNIASRSDIGTYTYGNSAKPHQVTKVSGGSRTYQYDVVGNMVKSTQGGVASTFQYNSYNKPSKFTSGETKKTYTFSYGVGYQMVKRTAGNTQTFFGDGWEYESDGLFRTYVGSNLVELYNQNSKTVTIYGLLRDHLGSVEKTVNLGTRGVVSQHSYDFAGKARNPTTWSDSYTPKDSFDNTTSSGFTNQMDFAKESLIHMGGRLYDAVIMRFYNADPYGAPVGNLQGLNKYSYVMNRPLSDSDPTGYKHHFFKHFFHKFLKVVLKLTKWAIDAALLVACAGPECAAAFNMAYTIVKDKIEGEGWKGALLDGLASFASWEVAGGINPEMSEEEQFARHLTVGLVQGGNSAAHGGSFVSGFVGGFNFDPYANPFLKEGSMAGTAEFESQEELMKKAESATEHAIANQLGVPQPLVHKAHELVMGVDTLPDFSKVSAAVSKVPNIGKAVSSIRPFDVVDAASRLSGAVSFSSIQTFSASAAQFVTTMVQQGPSEISAIIDVGFFRGTIPIDGIPGDMPGIPGGNPYLGGYISVQFAPLGISITADARVSPGYATYGVFAGSDKWNVYVPVKQGSASAGDLFADHGPTAKANHN